MRRHRIVILSGLLLCSSLIAQQTQGPVNDQRIMDLVSMGVSESEAIWIIATAPKFDFDLRPTSTDAMMKHGVSEEVIKAMSARQNGLAVATPSSTVRPYARVATTPATSEPVVKESGPSLAVNRRGRDQALAELQSVRTVFIVGNSEAANALRDKLQTYTCLEGALNPANADATLTVEESARQSYSVLLGHDNKISASVVMTMPNGDQVWTKNKLGGDGFIHSGAGFASVNILRALAKDACPGWSLRNEGKSGTKFHKDYQRSTR